MPKVKLLLLVTQSHWGGAQKYVYDLARGLPKNYDVTVAAGSDGPLLKLLQQKGVKTWEIPELVRPISPVSDLRALLKIYRKLKEENFDIIHTNSSKAGVIGRLAGKLSGTKGVTYTVHGLVLNEPLSIPTKSIYWVMEKLGAVCSGKIIAVSKKDQDSVDSYKLKNKGQVEVIPVGIGPIQVPQQKHQSLTVGTIANFYPTKGYKYYLPAISQVLKVHPEVRFVIVGRGPEEEFIKHEIKNLLIESAVSIVDRPTGAVEELGSFDIFVLPSVKEGMPYTILEAMQAKLPIIATIVGGIPEQIEDGKSGLLVPSRSSQALSEAILSLVSNEPLRQTLGEAAYVRVNKDFTLKRMVGRTEQFYRSIIS